VIDRHLLPLVARLLGPLARRIAARGIAADQLTLAGFAVGITAPLWIWAGWMGLALVAIAINRLADGLDGMVARIRGPTDRGAFLDIALDFVFYAAVPLGFALNDPAANALPAVVLVVAFVGTMSSFLAFATIAARRGLSAAAYPTKGIYYLGGLTEGTETILFFVAICLWPGAFPWLALIFAAACAVTTVTRWHMGWRAFGAM
jgi:phosphatidylglycerophosphate synthase